MNGLIATNWRVERLHDLTNAGFNKIDDRSKTGNHFDVGEGRQRENGRGTLMEPGRDVARAISEQTDIRCLHACCGLVHACCRPKHACQVQM